jgi:uncharacterized iron-regulated membrane protein
MIAKRRLLPIHRWAGLIACLVLLVQAGSGTLLVFRNHLAELVDPAGMTRNAAAAAGQAPLSRVLASAQARFPGYAIQRAVFPQTPRGVYLVELLDGRGDQGFVSVDPGSGAALRSGGLFAFPLEAALQIHYRLLTGRLGLACMMASGLALLTLAVSGLLYWWPKAGRWRRSLSIEARAPARLLLRRLHRNVGVFAAAAALLIASTGLAVATEFILAPGPLTTPRATADRLVAAVSDDVALARARTIYPRRGIRDVRTHGAGRLDVFFWAPEQSPHAVDAVSLDPRDGRVLAVRPATSAPGLWMYLLPLHSGDSFGRAGSLVVLAAALAFIGLAITGPLMWLQRPRGSSKRLRRSETP